MALLESKSTKIDALSQTLVAGAANPIRPVYIKGLFPERKKDERQAERTNMVIAARDQNNYSGQ